VIQQQRARKRKKALHRLKRFRELLMLVFGTKSINVIVAETSTVNKDPTADWTNKETTVNCYQAS
jgi:hypothetical protein